MFKTLLSETQFLPPIEFFCCLQQAENHVIEAYEHYQKQTYRTRCYILGANHIQCLSVPVIKPSGKVPTRDVQIDKGAKHINEHWRSIQSAYGKAPFFEYFAEYFQQIFEHPPTYLIDWNHQLLTICLKLLNMTKDISITENYVETSNEHILDIRSAITPKTHFTNRPYYQAVSYHQTFGKDFVPNLSIIDLLMNEGPRSQEVVTKSVKRE